MEAMTDEPQNTQPASETPAADPVAELKAALAAAEEKAAANWDSYLRAVAEQDNIRKRGQRDLEGALKYGVEKLAGELLPVKDSLEMALASIETHPEAESLRAGIEMTLKLLAQALEKQGVKEVNPTKGEAFNPELHEAMAAQPTAEVPEHAILSTVQKGYALNGRLLRPARVLVAKAPAG